jgi:hypothetical protein
VVRVPGYRSRGPGLISLNLVRITEELFEGNSVFTETLLRNDRKDTHRDIQIYRVMGGIYEVRR